MNDLFYLPYILIPALGNLEEFNADYHNKIYFVQKNGAIFVVKHLESIESIEQDRLIRTVEETLTNEYLIRLK